MKKILLLTTVLCISFFCFTPGMLAAKDMDSQGEGSNHQMHKPMIDDDKMENLIKQGYTKKEIFIALHMSKKANFEIDEILSYYTKSNKSWEATAKHFGINFEEFKRFKKMNCEFFKKNQTAIIQVLADYLDKKPEEINAYIKDGISLRFLVAAAAISELSDKSIEEIIKLKQQGQSLQEISQTLQLNHQQIHEEINEILDDVKPTGEKD